MVYVSCYLLVHHYHFVLYSDDQLMDLAPGEPRLIPLGFICVLPLAALDTGNTNGLQDPRLGVLGVLYGLVQCLFVVVGREVSWLLSFPHMTYNVLVGRLALLNHHLSVQVQV